MAHHTNLAVQTLSNLPLVSCIEILFKYLYDPQDAFGVYQMGRDHGN
jgi:hypothetical protein